MLDNTLVTAQTGPDGRKVQTLYLTEGCDIEHEYYLAIVLDRETAQSVIIASTEGGMDIEEVAAARQTERGNRADDKRSETSMEDRKKEGYF